jgi:hypothetical protein
MGVPTPFCYEVLCRYLKQTWPNLKQYFKERTKAQPYKISQIHIRKQKKSPLLFNMSYQDRHGKEDIVSDIRLSARFLVETDISTCFPSIYTHSLEWAITSRDRAKDNLKNCRKEWGGDLDAYVRSLRDGETGGILIGPHASNLIAEIVLTRIDEELQQAGYNFIRNIDDYVCYVDSHDKAETFLSELKDALGKYNLSINYKKTTIKELPLSVDDTWKQRLKYALVVLSKDKIEKDSIATFLDMLVDIMKEYKNGAVFSYAVKVLSGRYLAEEARQYYVKFILHLAYCYPYLYQYLDEYLFYAFDVETDSIRGFAEQMLKHGYSVRNFEECSYALFFAIKYNFQLDSFNAKTIIGTQDAILMAIAWQYVSCFGIEEEKKVLHDHALSLNEKAFEENWILGYEALTANELPGPWKTLKKKKVSFLKRAEEIVPSHTPTYEAFPIVWSCRISDPTDKSFNDLYKEFINDHPQHVSSTIANEYLQCLLGNLLVDTRMKKNVLIYRSQSHYLDKPPFGRHGEAHDCQILKTILDWLKSKHYIGERVGTRQTGGSCFWPKDVLREKFKHFNLKSLFRIDETPWVVLKDKNKEPVIPVPETSKAREYRQKLGEINAMYDRHRFGCALHGADSIDGFSPRLKAVFNDSRWDHGGRLYASATMVGFNYQCIPSDIRKRIVIDEAPTVEVDYSGMHPHLLYARLGKPLSGNAYDFLPVEDKPLAKFALLVMLNARSKQAAIGALKMRLDELRVASGLSPKKEALRNALLHHSDFEKVVDAAANKHNAIRTSFYRGTGILLQNIESKIALDIVHYFALRDIPVLPVHDSFIIDRKHRAQLSRKMEETFKKHNHGFSCPVK